MELGQSAYQFGIGEFTTRYHNITIHTSISISFDDILTCIFSYVVFLIWISRATFKDCWKPFRLEDTLKARERCSRSRGLLLLLRTGTASWGSKKHPKKHGYWDTQGYLQVFFCVVSHLLICLTVSCFVLRINPGSEEIAGPMSLTRLPSVPPMAYVCPTMTKLQ